MTAPLSTLLVDIAVEEVIGDPAVPVTEVTNDSRAVVPGALYCCIVGRRADGHDFAGAAVGAGASSLLVERTLDVAVPQVRVRSARRAMAPIAAAFFGHPSARLPVVGVTGTNGKTTTVHLLAAVLAAAGRRTGVIGTLDGALTTPEAPALQRRLAGFVADGFDAVAMEVSSIALDEHRADAITFAAAVWTNLTQDHLDYHGDMEAYFAAKASLFDPDRCRLAVLNADDAWGRRLLAAIDGRALPTVTYALGDAEGLRLFPRRSTFRWRGTDVELPMGGRHNVANALAAATTAAALGVPPAAVAEGLASATTVPGRWEAVDEGQPFTVVVDYAHTPDGLAQVLGAARAAAGGHRVLVVFGCGGDRDRAKRPQMAATATALADLVVLTSDNPRSEDPLAIIGEAAAGAAPGAALVVEADRREAIALAIGRAAPGDLVVVAGKGHETGQVIGDRVVPFDDRAVVREVLQGAPARW
ncbi:MAG TPA: UDP-N-acetylmuramoyl-L-alanyl-D-glutamate--2,6-diaminopimelate ligase [Acidimicrobiales bacterium]|nr:UDP-N-acetylmuramoyl-L-alanyl-D-glutamate--2,6-diaminopimelate ligase [Acidimicrobiales bacterium]